MKVGGALGTPTSLRHSEATTPLAVSTIEDEEQEDAERQHADAIACAGAAKAACQTPSARIADSSSLGTTSGRTAVI